MVVRRWSAPRCGLPGSPSTPSRGPPSPAGGSAPRDPPGPWRPAVALGDLFLEPDGLRCADLQALGYGAKDAVDHWFLCGAPPLMDADADGIPCETVFPDVERYLPAYY
jgi:hypothetical protein